MLNSFYLYIYFLNLISCLVLDMHPSSLYLCWSFPSVVPVNLVSLGIADCLSRYGCLHQQRVEDFCSLAPNYANPTLNLAYLGIYESNSGLSDLWLYTDPSSGTCGKVCSICYHRIPTFKARRVVVQDLSSLRRVACPFT